MHESSFFQLEGIQELSFSDLWGQNTNRRSDSYEICLTPPTHLKKAIGRNGMEIGLPVLQICMKITFSTQRLSRTEFFGFGGQNANRRSDSYEA